MEDHWPFVSVIIPAKNESSNIGKCLIALNNIDYAKSKYEVIVVDNGSDDDTAKIAEKLNAKVYVKPNMSISGLRNFGAKISKGAYLAFIDADIVVHEDWLKSAIMSLKKETVGCVGCSPELPPNTTWVERTWHRQIEIRPSVEIRRWIASMNIILKRKAFFDAGGFNEALLTCEDVDLGYKISKEWEILGSKSIRVTHLGEAKTLKNLFKKEFWRGKNSFYGIKSHGFVRAELPSLIVPVFTLMSIGTIIVGSIGRSIEITAIGILAILAFPIAKGFHISVGLRTVKYLPHLTVVWFVYCVARTCSALAETRLWLKSLWHN